MYRAAQQKSLMDRVQQNNMLHKIEQDEMRAKREEFERVRLETLNEQVHACSSLLTTPCPPRAIPSLLTAACSPLARRATHAQRRLDRELADMRKEEQMSKIRATHDKVKSDFETSAFYKKSKKLANISRSGHSRGVRLAHQVQL